MIELILFVTGAFIIAKFIFVWFWKYPSGYTVWKAKNELQSTTHCGKYWNVKAKFNIIKSIVYVEMSGNERVQINLITGKRTRNNWDY